MKTHSPMYWIMATSLHRSRTRSVRLQQHMADLQLRTAAAAAGLSVDAYRAAIGAAYLFWSERRPWRWLTEPMRGVLFAYLGRRNAARFVARWNTEVADA